MTSELRLFWVARDGVVALWVPFAKLLLDNVETIRDLSGSLGIECRNILGNYLHLAWEVIVARLNLYTLLYIQNPSKFMFSGLFTGGFRA